MAMADSKVGTKNHGQQLDITKGARACLLETSEGWL